jgi:hypothetical protein
MHRYNKVQHAMTAYQGFEQVLENLSRSVRQAGSLNYLFSDLLSAMSLVSEISSWRVLV